MSFWVFLDYQLETTIVIFGISTLKFAEMQKNVENLKKKKKIRTKYTLSGHQFEKVLSYFQQPLICHLDFLTNTTNFGKGSAFSIGRVPVFSSGPLFLKVRYIKYDI